MKHRCGGDLVPARVYFLLDEASTALTECEGWRCAGCGEELISAETAQWLFRREAKA